MLIDCERECKVACEGCNYDMRVFKFGETGSKVGEIGVQGGLRGVFEGYKGFEVI